METPNKTMIYDVDEAPKRVGERIILAIQHVLAMFVACITVPMIVFGGYVTPAGQSLAGLMIAPTLVSAGIGTLFYLFVTKCRSPMFLASSFAYMTAMSVAIGSRAQPVLNGAGEVIGMTANLWILPIGMAFVGLTYCLVAFLIRLFGVGWLNKLLPPIVVGPVIMVIGLSLAGSAINNLNGTAAGDYNLIKILCGLIAMVVTALCAHYGKKTVSLIPFLLGMLAGYVAGAIFTGIGWAANNDYLKVIDFSPIVNTFNPIRFASFLDYPKFIFLANVENAGVGQLTNVALTGGDVATAALLFIPVSFVTICEHIGDHKNMSGILGRDLLQEPGLTRTLIGDGVATALSGGLCGAANTTYGENVAVVGVTKIASVRVIILACLISIGLGFFSPIMAITQTIPACVTGGVSLILYGFIASSGVKMLLHEHIDFTKTKNIFVASVILIAGIGGLALSFGGGENGLTITVTSVAVSMILGILMNLILKDKKEEPAAEKGPESQEKE